MAEVILLGGGGHARSLLAALRLSGVTVLGYLAPRQGTLADNFRYLGDDETLGAFDAEAVRFVNGLGSTASTAARRALYERAVAQGFRSERVIHPRAFVDPNAVLGAGAQILAGVVVNVGARIGEDALINSGAVIEHDTVIGAHAHVAPGAVLAGDVQLGEGVHIGLGARIVQGITIGQGAVVGAGAVVIADVSAGAVVAGVPARTIQEPARANQEQARAIKEGEQ